MTDAKCALCGGPMPEGEQMFKYHGHSGPCPKPPPLPQQVNPEHPDEGTVFLERLEDGTVQLKVRSPGAHGYSFVNMTWDEWTKLRALDPAPNEPTIAF